jgi:hypothetical protein
LWPNPNLILANKIEHEELTADQEMLWVDQVRFGFNMAKIPIRPQKNLKKFVRIAPPSQFTP